MNVGKCNYTFKKITLSPVCFLSRFIYSYPTALPWGLKLSLGSTSVATRDCPWSCGGNLFLNQGHGCICPPCGPGTQRCRMCTIPPKFSQRLPNWLPGGHSLSVQTRPARCLTWILLGLTSHKPLPWRRTCDGFVVPKALGTKSSGFSWALEMPPSLTHILSGAPSNPPVCPDAHDASYAPDQVRPPLMSFLTI